MTDDPTHPSFDLQSFLPYRLNRLADKVSEQLAHLYESSYSLTIVQWRVLASLSGAERDALLRAMAKLEDALGQSGTLYSATQ